MFNFESTFKIFLSAFQVKILAEKFTSCHPLMKTYILGISLLVLTASIHMPMISIENREKSFTNELDLQEAVKAGLFKDKDGRLRCFHCGCLLLHPDGSHRDENSLLREHRRVSPNCFMQRLLRLLKREDPPDVDADASKFARAMRKLRELLKDRMLQLVKEFGYNDKAIAYESARYFMTNDGKLPDSPGQLISRLQDEQKILRMLREKVAILELLDEALESRGSLRAVSREPSAVKETERQATRRQSSVRQEDGAASDGSRRGDDKSDSPLCHVCQRRQLNRALLPCGHANFCHKCVESLLNCPSCGVAILGIVAIFLS